MLRRVDATTQRRHWRGHRLYAVDGSKLNLPRGLLEEGYQRPSDNAHYPQGLLSCLYQLHSQAPADFDLVAHADERKAARAHLHTLSPGDVVVYDRGYFSTAMLLAHVERGLHAVFRLKTNANREVSAFVNSGATDAEIALDAGEEGQAPLRLRLVRYEIADQAYFLGTTLRDREHYRIAGLAKVYHAPGARCCTPTGPAAPGSPPRRAPSATVSCVAGNVSLSLPPACGGRADKKPGEYGRILCIDLANHDRRIFTPTPWGSPSWRRGYNRRSSASTAASTGALASRPTTSAALRSSLAGDGFSFCKNRAHGVFLAWPYAGA